MSKDDSYWQGYIQKQNEAMEICKQCKYRNKANKYDSLVKKIEDKIEEETSILYSLAITSNPQYDKQNRLIQTTKIQTLKSIWEEINANTTQSNKEI